VLFRSPDHREKEPSFYIGEFEDGAQWFRCYGCGRKGNSISFLAQMQGRDNASVLRDLCRAHGIGLGDFDPSRYKPRLPKEATARFSDERVLEDRIIAYARRYIEMMNGSEDSINKVGRLYQNMDRLTREGDVDGLTKLLESLIAYMADLKRPRKPPPVEAHQETDWESVDY